MNKWYTQLFKKINLDPALKKLKLTEESFSENYRAIFR